MANKSSDGGRAIYAAWGGYAADPIRDPDLFATLPINVQKEKWALRRIWDSHPELTAAEGVELLKKKQETAKFIPDVPNWFKFHCPDVPYDIFHGFSVEPDFTPEQMAVSVAHVLMEPLLAACTTEDGSDITTSKPLDGVFAYIWRLARFTCGLDDSVPVTCFLDLADGLGRLGLPMTYSKPMLAWLQSKADAVVESVKKDKDFAREKYGRVVGYI